MMYNQVWIKNGNTKEVEVEFSEISLKNAENSIVYFSSQVTNIGITQLESRKYNEDYSRHEQSNAYPIEEQCTDNDKCKCQFYGNSRDVYLQW